jgi:hypothetical protein
LVGDLIRILFPYLPNATLQASCRKGIILCDGKGGLFKIDDDRVSRGPFDMKNEIGKALVKAEMILDHLLLGIADLDRGIQWVCEKTGLKPTTGGTHPGAGTRNALLSLGNRQYVEIISIDPQQNVASRTTNLIRDLKIPRLITWAAVASDINVVARRAKSAGYAIEGPTDGSRVKPAGVTLRWKTLRVLSEFGDVIPFFIEWQGDVVHPSEDFPTGCRLMTFEIHHPDADRVQQMLRNLGIDAIVKSGREPNLQAVLSTPTHFIHLP